MTEPVLLDLADGIATLTLNRPSAGNALNMELATLLHRHAESLASNADVRVVVIRATGKLFCAGGDVRDMAGATDRSGFLRELADGMHRALLALRELTVPLIVAVQGPAAGGGLGLVLAADIAVAADTATFVAAYSAIGLSPDCGVTALLPNAVGARRAALFALTNSRLTAAQAEEWGLISEAVSADALEARVAELARLVADRPGESAGQAARLLRNSPERSYAEQLDDEATTIARLSDTAAASALIEAFAKR
ncbi:enoyl-CoA hydratase/isomerase family protein [Jatrophihabitans sp.]|uniref:enoyl-CoA hydratase/isomerase family protein n=1 Tax=Jatrophihabitans sp. TaxID=1932789 RepID=UPI0030C75B19|nr:enoyl-CoA hydratase/isomerase family protein [Jatrophihabitans sp.]